jgi:hypothetical protein
VPPSPTCRQSLPTSITISHLSTINYHHPQPGDQAGTNSCHLAATWATCIPSLASPVYPGVTLNSLSSTVTKCRQPPWPSAVHQPSTITTRSLVTKLASTPGSQHPCDESQPFPVSRVTRKRCFLRLQVRLVAIFGMQPDCSDGCAWRFLLQLAADACVAVVVSRVSADSTADTRPSSGCSCAVLRVCLQLLATIAPKCHCILNTPLAAVLLRHQATYSFVKAPGSSQHHQRP